ncbi:alcohol dehydrogenase [Kurthia zopfii]|uniref:Alcohol dehydrogenase n=1 Tax=Kurthia zopfii TaxID=1650 RepID=A0A8B4QC29_9BACL|nr:zinc-binding dehydrogenase [Kurthia zopfii]PWI23059.1 alcohol dehydrogenase [Kurthia zopfii]TDR40520.1 zinc-binding alcohol dehydrogenase/oxidoreductase [Kurthia zopfii]GEK30079.1 alcohol dehydrogenase [Kurthia zopfii]STX10259.1 Alcohol dehydrogenase [Kurthia zopfii]
MKAVFFEKGRLIVGEQEEPTLQKGEVLVKIKSASVNRRDLYTPNRLGNEAEALILGSDAAGIIEEISEDVKSWHIGDEVIINPSLRWFDESLIPPDGFEILSLPDHGTFAEKIAISAEQLEKKPAYLSWEEAATIGIAPLTGYRALFTKGEIKKGQTIFIPGAGSGVATFIIQLAHKVGARVIVTSRSASKREAALAIGADLALDTAADWQEALKDEVIDLVIDSVGEATFNRSLQVLKKGGTFVTFGATTADITSINLREFFYGQYNLKGTTLGSREEFRKCIQFMTEHNIHPIIDVVYNIEEAQKAFERLQVNEQFGKIVLTM